MYNSENKTCQNCKASFIIDASDFEFYDKIKVPPPTFCPECRFRRHLVFRNEKKLYKRSCDLCNRNIVSIYYKDSPHTIYCQKCWWSDNWDLMKYGRDYDFEKPFFEQLKELWLNIPQLSLINDNAVNSEYCNITQDNKNCYLVFGGDYNEDCSYSVLNFNCKDSLDLYWVSKGELSYELVDCDNNYKVFFSRYADGCHNSFFLYDCHNCLNCFGCVGLRNKSYNIFNKQYTKEEYVQKIKEMDLGSYSNLVEEKKKFNDLQNAHPHKYAMITNSNNCTGDNIKNSKNCGYVFDIHNNLENSKHIALSYIGGLKRDLESVCHLSKSLELCYDSCSVMGGSRVLFSEKIWDNVINIQYSHMCINSQNLFGCIGLRNKQYCILNKQYTKEQYEELVPKIIQHMNDKPYIDKQGRTYKYGEFFPPELSPFAYNETIAQEYFPLTKEQAIQQGYTWKEPETRNYKITLKSNELPDHIKDISDSIVNEIIGCEHKGTCDEQCTTAFKIIPKELQFYKQHNIPLPHLCPNCRHYQRIKQRNPLKLWNRKCMCAGAESDNKIYKNTINHPHHNTNHCSNEFQTTYAPERKEIVYCEKCYQQEVV